MNPALYLPFPLSLSLGDVMRLVFANGCHLIIGEGDRASGLFFLVFSASWAVLCLQHSALPTPGADASAWHSGCSEGGVAHARPGHYTASFAPLFPIQEPALRPRTGLSSGHRRSFARLRLWPPLCSGSVTDGRWLDLRSRTDLPRRALRSVAGPAPLRGFSLPSTFRRCLMVSGLRRTPLLTLRYC